MHHGSADLSKLLRLPAERLDMVAATLDHVCAEIEDPQRLGRLLGAQVEPDWPPGQYDHDAQEFFRDRLREGGPSVVGWYGWYALRRSPAGEPAVLVGAGGYLGLPDEMGQVEIGFSVAARWRGRGYATEMVETLVARALADPRVLRIVARTTADNQACCRVLEKTGFRRAGGDEPSGELLFERRPPETMTRPDAK